MLLCTYFAGRTGLVANIGDCKCVLARVAEKVVLLLLLLLLLTQLCDGGN